MILDGIIGKHRVHSLIVNVMRSDGLQLRGESRMPIPIPECLELDGL